jgi:hypothetical protein
VRLQYSEVRTLEVSLSHPPDFVSIHLTYLRNESRDDE